jgi:hypothetical protein
MRKSISLLMFAATFFTAVSAQAAYTSIMIKNFTATASVASNYVVNVNPKVKGSNATASTYTFGAQSNGNPYTSVPLEYMDIDVDDNAALWKLQTYTKNFTAAPSTTTWGFSYGGLIGATAGNKVSMAWQVMTTTTTTGPTTAVPGINWTYFKDYYDVRTDTTTGVDTTSFAAAQDAGYCNIAYGGAGIGTTAIVNSVAEHQVALPTKRTHFYMYAEADFSTAPADPTYTGKIVIELYHP